MPVQPAHECLSSVQIESVCFEAGSSETERNGPGGSVLQRHAEIIHDRRVSVPGPGFGNSYRDPAAVHRSGGADVPAAIRYLKCPFGG